MVAGGEVPDGEPTWMAEGMAEFAAGLARVAAFSPGLTFPELHVMKVRLFADWPYVCSTDLSFYDTHNRELNDCEYILGFLAIELLVSQFGGLQKLLEVYRSVASGLGYRESFQSVYGMSLDSFEQLANDYIKTVATVGFGTSFRLPVRG